MRHCCVLYTVIFPQKRKVQFSQPFISVVSQQSRLERGRVPKCNHFVLGPWQWPSHITWFEVVGLNNTRPLTTEDDPSLHKELKSYLVSRLGRRVWGGFFEKILEETKTKLRCSGARHSLQWVFSKAESLEFVYKFQIALKEKDVALFGHSARFYRHVSASISPPYLEPLIFVKHTQTQTPNGWI